MKRELVKILTFISVISTLMQFPIPANDINDRFPSKLCVVSADDENPPQPCPIEVSEY